MIFIENFAHYLLNYAKFMKTDSDQFSDPKTNRSLFLCSEEHEMK